MRILVTGAGGFVGRHLLTTLLRGGDEVVAASHRPFAAPAGVPVEVFDLADAGRTAAAVGRHRPAGVIHLAAQASVRLSWTDPAGTYATNITGTGNLLEALRERPDTRVLLVGSAQQYGNARLDRPLREDDPPDPPSPYAVSKVAQEMIGRLYRRTFGLGTVMARAFNHTGPGQSAEYAVGSFCSQIVAIERAEQPPRLRVGSLDTVRDFLDVRDVVAAYRLLLERGTPGEAYNVASGEGRSIGDLLKILLDAAGLTGTVEVEEAPPRAGDPESLIGDSSRLRGLGWEPGVVMEQSLLDTLHWYRAQAAEKGRTA